MKSKLVIVLLTCCSVAADGIAQTIDLSGNWTYTIGAVTSTGQSKPSEKEIPWVQKDSLLKKTGMVMFRKKVLIPSSIKEQWTKTGVAALYLGRILQADETFFNGISIGKTGSSDVQRVYTVPGNIINWDKENTIELSVEHWGEKGGALTVPYLAEAKPQHVFSIQSINDESIRKSSALNKNNTHLVEVKSVADKITDGVIAAEFYNNKNVLIHKEEKNISIKNGINTFPFEYRSPSSFLNIRYTLKVPLYQLELAWNEVAGYEPVVYHAASPKVTYKVPLLFEPADLYNQKMAGWLGERFNINLEKRLKKVDEFALLEGYINRPGKHSWIGEHVGKFIEAACNTYKSTGDDTLKMQIDRTVQQLLASQNKDGYLGTYTTDNEWTSWDVWSHKYNLVGLLGYYELSGYEPALTGARLIGDLLVRKFGRGEGQKNIVKAGAHVGMAATSVIDPMTDLYFFTEDKKYLDFCYYIVDSYNVKDGPAIIHTLNATGGRVNQTANAKAYEMMSNLVGLIKLYKLTSDTSVFNPVLKAWKDITEKRLYITGTTSSFEHFQDDYVLPASVNDHMGEGCVTTTWIQINYQLLLISGKMQYLDQLERAVYNHLTGAENPQTGCVSYYTPLQGRKPYGCNITCCMSSVPRGIAMIPLFANGKIKNQPSFLFYQPGEYKTTVSDQTNKNLPVVFKTSNDFLEQGDVTIDVNPATASAFSILLRKPYWSKDFTVTINGTPLPPSQTEIISVKRQWKKGDKVSIHFALPVTALYGNKSYPGTIALQRGPQILAYDESLNKKNAADIKLPSNNVILQDASSALPQNWIGKQGYIIEAGNNRKEKIMLVPYADASQTGGVISTWMKKEN